MKNYIFRGRILVSFFYSLLVINVNLVSDFEIYQNVALFLASVAISVLQAFCVLTLSKTCREQLAHHCHFKLQPINCKLATKRNDCFGI